ncbi:hypothetical protein scyTo_0006934 [Scyliorhinus torazame]|uniref:Uncharacterized protein n=1 Tax=Scyliorhinus torazame TaxID=75743 RepID=A0A401NIW1_SCYTO|nr:hypothetical protein [Scyliorhinus torazame]
MWGRNCHVIDANRPASHKFWSPQKIDLGIQDIHSVSCGYWHATALTGYPTERHHGNKESGFSETGESFKGDNHYPKLMESSQEEKRDGIRATELKNTEEYLENLQSAIQPGKEGSCQDMVKKYTVPKVLQIHPCPSFPVVHFTQRLVEVSNTQEPNPECNP